MYAAIFRIAISRSFKRIWFLPVSISFALGLGRVIATGIIDWFYIFAVFLASFSAAMLITVPVEYHAAVRKMGRK